MKNILRILLIFLFLSTPAFALEATGLEGYDYYTWYGTTADDVVLGWKQADDYKAGDDFELKIYNPERKITHDLGFTLNFTLTFKLPKTGHWITKIRTRRLVPEDPGPPVKPEYYKYSAWSYSTDKNVAKAPVIDTALSTLDLRVSISANDAEENITSKAVNLSSSDLEMVFDLASEQIIGIRTQLAIPQRSIISKAYLQFQTDEIAGSSGTPVTRNLVVKYDFTETFGTVITDMAPGDPLNLEITEPAKVSWLDPGLRVSEATVIKATSARTKLNPVDFFANGYTIETWVKPANNTQSGPARIVTFSADSGNRNFTFGQSADKWNQRFRTTDNPGNGSTPSTSTPAGSIVLPTVLQHVIYTRNPSGNAIFYINGVQVSTENIPGDNNWDMSYDFGLFNEMNFPIDDRTWLGDIFLVAIYSTVLTPAEVTQNYNAGVPGTPVTGNTGLDADATFLIEGELADNSSIFELTTGNLSDRIRTESNSLWSPVEWTVIGEAAESQRTTDLTMIIQEIINRTSWQSDNFLTLIITGDTDNIGNRVAESFDGSASGAPILHVEYYKKLESMPRAWWLFGWVESTGPIEPF